MRLRKAALVEAGLGVVELSPWRRSLTSQRGSAFPSKKLYTRAYSRILETFFILSLLSASQGHESSGFGSLPQPDLGSLLAPGQSPSMKSPALAQDRLLVKVAHLDKLLTCGPGAELPKTLSARLLPP